MSGDIHALTGAYALDALDDIERAQVERHLADCESCREEVASLRETASLLAETTAVEPPAHLRGAVLTGIQSTRVLPPHLPERVQHRRWRAPALAVAAAALVVAGGLGATVWHPWSDDGSGLSAVPTSPVERVEDAPDAQTYRARTDDGAAVEIIRSRSLNEALLSADGLSRLPDEQTYQLWLMYDGNAESAGLMDGDASHVQMEGDPASATAAAITVEPSGGSRNPTTAPIMVVQFA